MLLTELRGGPVSISHVRQPEGLLQLREGLAAVRVGGVRSAHHGATGGGGAARGAAAALVSSCREEFGLLIILELLGNCFHEYLLKQKNSFKCGKHATLVIHTCRILVTNENRHCIWLYYFFEIKYTQCQTLALSIKAFHVYKC